MAIVHALRYLKRNGIDCPIYSDSQTAITWVQDQRVTARPARLGLLTPDVYSRLTRLLKWLSRNPQTNPIAKWDTETWEEIPADYGRK